MGYLRMLKESERQGLCVKEKPLEGHKGLIFGKRIAIKKDLTVTERGCVLAEELGHYYTNHGNILDQSCIKSRKQERRALGWAYEELVPLESILDAHWAGIQNKHELAEFLEVTEVFLESAIQYYKEKHGLYYEIKHYLIYFEPLGVYEKIS